MAKPLIIDLHLDLAWDALFWNRDLTLSAHEVRRQEETELSQVAEGFDCGKCSVTFPELRRGNVGIILSTIMSRIEPRHSENHRDGMWTQEQAMAVGRGHLVEKCSYLVAELARVWTVSAIQPKSRRLRLHPWDYRIP